ncbi:MAG: hypothetical protein WBA57_04700 [Elainellaceae cyanobacterium]
MTKTSPQFTTEPSPAQSSSTGWLKSFLVLIFRLLLLGVGSISAVLVGMAIATVFAAEVNEKPLLETALHRGSKVRRALQQSPGTALDILLGQDTTSTSEQSASSDLNSDSSLETVPAVNQTDNALRMTLPSDILFENSPSELDFESQLILESVVREIQLYPGATVQVSAYGDRAATIARNRQTAFEQAQAVQQYLAETLDEDLYHWVTIGYGKDGQSSGESENDEPLYRRVEISIILE